MTPTTVKTIKKICLTVRGSLKKNAEINVINTIPSPCHIVSATARFIVVMDFENKYMDIPYKTYAIIPYQMFFIPSEHFNMVVPTTSIKSAIIKIKYPYIN